VFSSLTLSILLLSQCGNPDAAQAPTAPLGGGLAYQQPFTPGQSPAGFGGGTATISPPSQFDPKVVPIAAQEDPQFAATAVSSEPAIMETPPADTVTHQELKAEVSKMAWRKGDFTIIPYGTIWGSMSYDSQRSRIGDYALWLESQDLHHHEPDFNVDAKSTRLGVDITGPPSPFFCDAKVGGKVEVDFQGQFVTRNKPGLLLRHAYIEAKNDDFRLLVGQTWDVISPLAIPTLNYTAGSAVGNLAYRRAQFRVERFLAISDVFLVTLQSSVNGNVVTDFVSDPATTTSADPGPYPDFQARAGFTLGERSNPDIKPIVLGVGGHYGIQSFDFRTAPVDLGVDVPTYSLATDLVVPMTQRFGVQGEFFTGSNLSNYMGGILQGIDRVTHHGIRATGGWVDVYFDWCPNLHSHSGFAIDDPFDQDMTSGRVRNQMIFNNLIWDASKNLQLGFEVDVWETHYIALAPGEGVRMEFTTKYSF
jgi:hypothetical protein